MGRKVGIVNSLGDFSNSLAEGIDPAGEIFKGLDSFLFFPSKTLGLFQVYNKAHKNAKA